VEEFHLVLKMCSGMVVRCLNSLPAGAMDAFGVRREPAVEQVSFLLGQKAGSADPGQILQVVLLGQQGRTLIHTFMLQDEDICHPKADCSKKGKKARSSSLAAQLAV
jgi:hypothetical protein